MKDDEKDINTEGTNGKSREETGSSEGKTQECSLAFLLPLESTLSLYCIPLS